MGDQPVGEWVRYRRFPDAGVEAMHAHFQTHAYHRHSHDTYSFGVTERGAQFTCRGSAHTSAAGMVMAFNPDDPHDGHAGDRSGFTYRMVHIPPGVVDRVLAHAGGRARHPLFADPVISDPALADQVRRLHAAIDGGSRLEIDERLAETVLALVAQGTTLAPAWRPTTASESATIARRVRSRLADAWSANISADDLADAAGCSRYAAYRAFRSTYGLAPSEYQRLLRLRTARRLLAEGVGPAQVAAEAGFADQAHLTRWFVRAFGITPGAYARAETTRPGSRPGGRGPRRGS